METRLSLHGTQTEHIWHPDFPYGMQIEFSSHPNVSHIVPKWSPHGAQVYPTWYPNEGHMVPRLIPSGTWILPTCCLVFISTVHLHDYAVPDGINLGTMWPSFGYHVG